MGWNTKSPETVIFSFNWHDYVSEEKIEKFEAEIKGEVKTLIETRFNKEFAQEISNQEITIFVN